jgi:hypothetical protein
LRYRPKTQQQPGWSINGNSYPILSYEPSRWEKFLIAEQIEEKDFNSNPKVLKFVKENWDKFYVPEKVLKMYGEQLHTLRFREEL